MQLDKNNRRRITTAELKYATDLTEINIRVETDEVNEGEPKVTESFIDTVLTVTKSVQMPDLMIQIAEHETRVLETMMKSVIAIKALSGATNGTALHARARQLYMDADAIKDELDKLYVDMLEQVMEADRDKLPTGFLTYTQDDAASVEAFERTLSQVHDGVPAPGDKLDSGNLTIQYADHIKKEQGEYTDLLVGLKNLIDDSGVAVGSAGGAAAAFTDFF
jgi:hypothetical protein